MNERKAEASHEAPRYETDMGERWANLRIVRAAIRDDRGGIWTVPVPGRHHDIIREMREAGYTGPVSGPDQQGFLLNDGRFICRRAAYRVAQKAGQFKNGEPIASVVTSEDLW